MHNKSYLDYLPDYLQRIREIKALASVVDLMLTYEENCISRVAREGIIMTAQDKGLEMWEKLLGLSGIGSVEERRSMILSFLSGSVPYTLKSIQNALDMICGKGNAKAGYKQEPYTLYITLSAWGMARRTSVEGLLRRVIPANISLVIMPDMNTHMELAAKTHGQLAGYTHMELNRREI